LVKDKEGWDVNKVESVFHLRTCQLLIENLKLNQNQFRHLGKRIITPIEDLKKQNITLIKLAVPLLPNLDTTTDPAPHPPTTVPAPPTLIQLLLLQLI